MVKKITKYLKFMICCALIMSLVAPSYAALSASDGSAFVTKAEFDSALADFNARLTTFEAGINSKIDSQVSSYLDRNGIWNGVNQTLTHESGLYWFQTVFDNEWISVRDVVENETEVFKQQLVWQAKKSTFMTDTDPTNAKEVYSFEPSIGLFTPASTEASTLDSWISKGDLGHRKCTKDVVLSLTKSGAVFLDVCLQRIINNQRFDASRDYSKLYAMWKFCDDYKTDKSVRLTDYHNLWDPTNPNYASFSGDSALFVCAPENWTRSHSISCASFLTINIDDIPTTSWYVGDVIPSSQWQVTSNINGGILTPGADATFSRTSSAGKEYTIHYNYAFGIGFAIQSTEPAQLGGLIFAKKGQKISFSLEDRFSGRRWKDYSVCLASTCVRDWTDPEFNALNDSNDAIRDENMYLDGYFVQVANCLVY